jgi:DNA/RNA endonuclease G (NUC1)/PKD repeat protein
MTRRRTLTPLTFALAFLSCNPGDRVAPSHPGALRADAVAGAALPGVRISEFHYDNAFTDVDEKVEISAPAGTDLAGWQLVLYNGTASVRAPYTTTSLGGLIIPATCAARGVVVITYPTNGIQNGSSSQTGIDPDGFALVNASGQVVEFLSYEGSFIALSGPAAGLTSTDVGIRELGTEPTNPVWSLSRNDGGVWNGPAVNTFGVCNDNDQPPPPPEVASVTVSPPGATVVQGATQPFTAAAFDAARQPIAGVTLSWASTAPTVASVNASGLATGLTPGDAGIVATAPNGIADTAELHVDEPPPPALPETRLSEIHYDNSGTDTGEAIEVEGPAGTVLTGWSIVLYNGNGGVVYNTRMLDGTLTDQCAGRGVVVATYPQDGIQNGSPDGLALVDAAGQVVEFLSYEGVFTAVGGPANGLTSSDIGVLESSSPVGQSLQRDDVGAWSAPKANTFGFCNSAPPPPPTNTITFTGRVSTDPALPVGFQDQLFATLRDGSGNAVATTFTWSSETPSVASIDPNGVMTALDAGTATVRATAAEGTTATFTLPTRVAVASTTAQYAGNTEFGEPTDGDPSDDFIVRHAQYTASYNRNRGTPNWVSYDLDATHFGSEDRCDCFTSDPALPPEFTHYTTADYTGAGAFHGYGIDRGHLARSFDRTSASLDNAFTFYFTNIVPQAADLNQGPWAVMESFLGDLARFQNKEVYIIAGVAGNKGTLKNEGKIVIPASTWKVAVILPRDHGLNDIHSPQDLEVIAVIMPNDPGVRDVDWRTYKTAVDAIEAATGYDFLAALPDRVERIVEANDHFPTASGGGPYAGVEGSAIDFSALGSTDPDGDLLTYAWDFGDGVTGGGPAPGHAYADNGIYTATVIATDPYGAADTASATVTVTNASPVITGLVVPAAPVAAGTPANVAVSFTDAGTADTHALTIDWGDGTTSGTTTHVYVAAGLYTVAATVRDDDGAQDSRAAASFVVVYDPTAGFATGSGWFGPSSIKAKFAFVAKYQAGVIGDGASAELQIERTGFSFTSATVEWLVVQAGRLKVGGTGTVAGAPGIHRFLLTAVDGPDGVRIRIWNAAGVVVYDNQPGVPDDAWNVTPLGGGNISVKERGGTP